MMGDDMSERDEFEKWAAKYFDIRNFMLHEDGNYFLERVADMYDAWKAAHAQQGADSGDAVAFAVSDTPGKVQPLSALYVRKALAEKHIAGYKEEFELHLVPLYTKPPANQVPEALWEALADCVSCFNCPEWSDKCEEVERRATKLLNSTSPTHAAQPDAGAGQWIPCSERLPTEADQDFHSCVWVCFIDGEIELHEAQEVIDTWDDDFAITHWMPTGLRKPEPPQTQGEE